MDSSFELLPSDQDNLNSSFTAIEAPGKPDEETMAGWITDAQNKLRQNLRDSTQALQSLRDYQGFRVPSDYEYDDVFALLGKLASDDSSYEVSHHDRNLRVLKLVGIDDERIRHLTKAGVLYYAAIVSSAITSTPIAKDYTEWLATASEVEEQLTIQDENNIANQRLYKSLKEILEKDIDDANKERANIDNCKIIISSRAKRYQWFTHTSIMFDILLAVATTLVICMLFLLYAMISPTTFVTLLISTNLMCLLFGVGHYLEDQEFESHYRCLNFRLKTITENNKSSIILLDESKDDEQQLLYQSISTMMSNC